MKCIRHNKNIIIEKPMCLNLNQLKENLLSYKKKQKTRLSNMVLRAMFIQKTQKKINISDVYRG